jgi:hypothetical protein
MQSFPDLDGPEADARHEPTTKSPVGRELPKEDAMPQERDVLYTENRDVLTGVQVHSG